MLARVTRVLRTLVHRAQRVRTPLHVVVGSTLLTLFLAYEVVVVVVAALTEYHSFVRTQADIHRLQSLCLDPTLSRRIYEEQCSRSTLMITHAPDQIAIMHTLRYVLEHLTPCGFMHDPSLCLSTAARVAFVGLGTVVLWQVAKPYVYPRLKRLRWHTPVPVRATNTTQAQALALCPPCHTTAVAHTRGAGVGRGGGDDSDGPDPVDDDNDASTSDYSSCDSCVEESFAPLPHSIDST